MHIKNIFIMKNTNLKFDQLRTCKHYIHTQFPLAKPLRLGLPCLQFEHLFLLMSEMPIICYRLSKFYLSDNIETQYDLGKCTMLSTHMPNLKL